MEMNNDTAVFVMFAMVFSSLLLSLTNLMVIRSLLKDVLAEIKKGKAS